jgi:single-strand DNA-binding protein
MRPRSSVPQRSGLNSVMLIGRLVADPELRRTSNGVVLTRFRMATNVGTRTEFHSVVAWRRLAELVDRQFRKGQLIRVDGSLHARKWTDTNGEPRRTVEVIAEWCYSMPREPDE